MKKSLYFLALLTTALVSCSIKEEAIDQNENKSAPRTWKVSINAGPADQTKAISVGGHLGSVLYTNWDDGDEVEVVKAGAIVGTLTADQSAGNSAYAKLGGTLTGTFAVNDEVTLCYHTAALDYTGQVGTIAGVSDEKSYMQATSTVQAINVGAGTIRDDVDYLSMSDAAFSPMQAYLDLVFMADDGVTPLEISSLDIWTDGGKLVKTKALDGTTVYATAGEPLTITPAAPTSKFFLALRDEYGDANNYHFKATVGGGTFVYSGSKNLEYGHYYTGNVNMALTGALSIPLTFEAKMAGTKVSFKGVVSNVEYSIDGGLNWASYTNSEITLANVGDRVMFRGNNNTYEGNGFNIRGSCYIYGNIMSLISSGSFDTATTLTVNSCFKEMFKGLHVQIRPDIPLLLPATTLTECCYQSMFYGTDLTSAPVLPAEELANDCYNGMFDSCKNLSAAPALPAMTLAARCYSYMFEFCTMLFIAPALPATTLANNCYQSMFRGCTSLTTAPATLPATTLVNYCYQNMFYGCTSLSTAPALPATTLANNCYQGMFSGCTSLSTAPALPATTLADNCYRNMFTRCTSLSTAPALPAITLTDYCYNYMFANCTNLTATPVLPATALVSQCYSGMFSGCTSLATVTCFATTGISNITTSIWLSSVPASGTFIINASLDPANPTPWTKNSSSGIPTGWTIIPVLPGQFSVSNTQKVFFSKGNLQYSRASTEVAWNTGTWSFMDHQYDIVETVNPESTINPPYPDPYCTDNYGDKTVVSLFGWGTGSNPTLTSDNPYDYSSFTDWGTNAITNGGNVTDSGWHTLSNGQWSYLIDPIQRVTPSGAVYAKATVNGVKGLILLPDNWSTSYYDLSSTNVQDAAFSANTITLSDWTTYLEAYGAVFLPAACYRDGNIVYDNGCFLGYYWSSYASEYNGYALNFIESNYQNSVSVSSIPRSGGLPVRLVKDVD